MSSELEHERKYIIYYGIDKWSDIISSFVGTETGEKGALLLEPMRRRREYRRGYGDRPHYRTDTSRSRERAPHPERVAEDGAYE